MQLCLFSGRFVGAFVLVASLAFTHPAFSLSPISNRVQGYLKKGCYSSEVKYHIEKGIIGTIHSSYATLDSGKYGRPSKWKYMKELKKVYASCDNIQKKINEFFHMAIKANEKRCQKEGWPCTLWHQRHQELYETALKNDDTILQVMIEKNSTYVRQNQKTIMAEIATKKQKAKEAAKKKAAEEAAKKKAAEEAAKKKAAEEKAAEKQAAIDDAFSVFDITAKEAAAKIKAAKEKAAAQEIKEDSSYILTNESLMEMFGDLPKQYQQLANIKNIKIEKLIDQTKMKTINSQGITRTMYCKPCTLGSPMLQTNSTGIDMGMPKVIYDGISEALDETFGGENPLKKSQIIKVGIGCYKELAKTINDPNINKAMVMPAEQLKQIKSQQRKTQASSNKSSGGSAEGHDHDHDHEEEDWRTAPGSIYYD